MTRCALILATALLIAACSNPWADDGPTRGDIFRFGWLNDDIPEGQRAAEPEGPLYCYRTIGREDCYATPIPGAAARLKGYVGPPPPEAEAAL